MPRGKQWLEEKILALLPPELSGRAEIVQKIEAASVQELEDVFASQEKAVQLEKDSGSMRELLKQTATDYARLSDELVRLKSSQTQTPDPSNDEYLTKAQVEAQLRTAIESITKQFAEVASWNHRNSTYLAGIAGQHATLYGKPLLPEDIESILALASSKHQGKLPDAYQEWVGPMRLQREEEQINNRVEKRVKEEIEKRRAQEIRMPGAGLSEGLAHFVNPGSKPASLAEAVERARAKLN